MNEPGYATPEVHRVIARDDLLMLAAETDEVVGIVGNQVSLAKLKKDDESLFEVALAHYLKTAREGRQASVRTNAWDSAAVIVRFGDLVGLRPASAGSPEEMHENALAENVSRKAGSRLDRALATGVINRYHAARNLRLIGEFERALPLVARPLADLMGTGAEPYMAHYLFERGAGQLAQGQAGQVDDALGEWDEYWEKTRAQGYSTRYRFEFLRALAYWDSDERSPQEALAQLDSSLGRLLGGVPVPVPMADGTFRQSDDDRGVREISVTLAKAELLTACATSDGERAEAAALGRRALEIANRVRGRMRVISRSRSPLAEAFRRLYGDIALLAARLADAGTPGAAELGLEVALAAKQTGFATRIRADRGLMNANLQGILDRIVELENKPENDLLFADDPDARDRMLGELHFQLGDKISAMLAETVLPSRVDLGRVTTALGGRTALDYLELPSSVGGTPSLYRSLLRPGQPILFERFEPDAGVVAFFQDRRATRDLFDWVGRFDPAPGSDSATPGGNREVVPRNARSVPTVLPTWADIAGVLPEALRADLASSPDDPMPLVISAHSWLSLVPWVALPIGEAGTRLVERAVVTQTPVLTCLTALEVPTADGPALVRLVGANKAGRGVNVSREREAWLLPAGTDEVRLSRAVVRSDQVPELCPELQLGDVLTRDASWSFLHVAAHGGLGPEEEAQGSHDGLRQVLEIPEQRLTAARALGLHWPGSVLMASCHVGQVVNTRDAEPLNFVMALLTGGARCVVAGIAGIGDEGTGNVAHDIVRTLRGGPGSLDRALRSAQLEAIKRDAAPAGWALLAAYVK
jgi:hypothetical protein